MDIEDSESGGPEFLLFNNVAWLSEEKLATNKKVASVLSIIALVAPIIREQDIRQYMKVAGVDLEDIGQWEVVRHFLSGYVAHNLITIAQYDEYSLFSREKYWELKTDPEFIAYIQNVREGIHDTLRNIE